MERYMTNKEFDGFYNAYFSGENGNSLAMFVFSDGRIAGADAGGGLYDGHYSFDDHNSQVNATITFILRFGHTSIAGATSGEEQVRVEVPVTLPNVIDPADIHRINTPLGPINARFQKVRGM